MGILVLVEAEAKPESVDRLVQLLNKGLPATRGADGCESLHAYLAEDGKTVVAIETWQSKAHYEQYLDWRRKSGALQAMTEMLEKPLRIRFLSALDV